jgi:hypothetical protein
MKNLLLIAIVLLIGTSAFKKKDNTSSTKAPIDEITIDSALQFRCDMEGDNLHYVKKQFHYIENKDSTIINTIGRAVNYSDDFFKPDFHDSGKLTYVSGFRNTKTKERFAITRGFIESYQGQKPAEVPFISLFVMGKYAFEEFKAELEYTDIDETKWTTTQGDQTGSNFEIIDYQSIGDRDRRACKAIIKFNCKLYNKKFPSKSFTINNGIALLEFAH